MTNAIFIPITQKQIEGEAVQTVDARALHEFLGVKEKFASWITRRITDFDFQENADFLPFSEISEKGLFRRPRQEYALSLDMAKELAMADCDIYLTI
ncbi:antA/AntB antirepressor family protein [Candidatus Tokpelaia sp.]|uniref:antA/AntB antirepressor family protein n=1 Tax=Candidatus Tokpelaia sp. TaxID=2233777 RepID=UPI00123A6324|nr:antA/AntB antirepressor family protein [Candidatus Tokpelaia sp.]KAA6405797.1 hypothetical protein DPQ22_02945 [Candidatus Tokpelaia sp.]